MLSGRPAASSQAVCFVRVACYVCWCRVRCGAVRCGLWFFCEYGRSVDRSVGRIGLVRFIMFFRRLQGQNCCLSCRLGSVSRETMYRNNVAAFFASARTAAFGCHFFLFLPVFGKCRASLTEGEIGRAEFLTSMFRTPPALARTLTGV